MSARLWLIRHGPTAWNAASRLQGGADIPLSPEGREIVAGWRLPEDLAGLPMVTSPLSRAQETAAILLNGGNAEIEPLLTEMDFGVWEGERLADLRRRLGTKLDANEAQGLDLMPPGGESPRLVLARLRPLLAAWGRDGEKAGGKNGGKAGGTARIAVTHKGVIRAIYAEAAGWDMTGKPPHRLSWDAAHGFDLDARGHARIAVLNRKLTAEDAP